MVVSRVLIIKCTQVWTYIEVVRSIKSVSQKYIAIYVYKLYWKKTIGWYIFANESAWQTWRLWNAGRVGSKFVEGFEIESKFVEGYHSFFIKLSWDCYSFSKIALRVPCKLKGWHLTIYFISISLSGFFSILIVSFF